MKILIKLKFPIENELCVTSNALLIGIRRTLSKSNLIEKGGSFCLLYKMHFSLEFNIYIYNPSRN